MNASELKERYYVLYSDMAQSKNPDNMRLFGKVMTQMMEDMIGSSPSKAEEYVSKLEAIRWRNYLTPSEADGIVSRLEPRWSREQWRQAMEKSGLDVEEPGNYNRCALYAVMNMVYAGSGETLSKYVRDDLFRAIYDLSLDLLDDKAFNIRHYYGL